MGAFIVVCNTCATIKANVSLNSPSHHVSLKQIFLILDTYVSLIRYLCNRTYIGMYFKLHTYVNFAYYTISKVKI